MRPIRYWNQISRKILELNSINELNEFDEPYLHYAVGGSDFVLVMFLICSGANPNIKNKENRTPLFTACCDLEPSIPIIKYLLDHGADVNSIDDRGCTVLHAMILEGFNYSHIIEILISYGAKLDLKNQNEDTPLRIAFKQGEGSIVPYLLNEEAEKYFEDIANLIPSTFFAAKNLDIKNLETHLQNCDINELNTIHQNMLHFILIFAKPGNKRLNMIKFLLKKGINANCFDYNSKTPLHLALHARDETAAKLLILHGCKVDILDDEKQTPLYVAITKNLIFSVFLLLRRNANPNRKVPLDLKSLKWHDDEIDIPLITYAAAASIDNPIIIALLIKNGANLNYYIDNYRTPLTQALASGNHNIAQYLIISGADVSLRDGVDTSPLEIVYKNLCVFFLDTY